MLLLLMLFVLTRCEEDLNRKNKGGWTALMYASYIGYDTVVNLLLEAGVEVNTRNDKGLTPLMLASSCGNESIAYFLLQVFNNGCNFHIGLDWFLGHLLLFVSLTLEKLLCIKLLKWMPCLISNCLFNQ